MAGNDRSTSSMTLRPVMPIKYDPDEDGVGTTAEAGRRSHSDIRGVATLQWTGDTRTRAAAHERRLQMLDATTNGRDAGYIWREIETVHLISADAPSTDNRGGSDAAP